ncbi:Zn-dependent proteases [Acholeplasma oculi]|nr:M50 family metallopeptidase [Acholeplasma oculi]SKC38066.1 Peptidase family M50 [Acholeplasma oculi]SUT91225.1 Zn-dependent proteases [Acholeplasma oculi]
MIMKKRFIGIFIYVLCVIIIGFLVTMGIYEGFFEFVFQGISYFPWYIHFLFILVALSLVITVHELGHFFTFYKYGIHVKAIYILFIAFVKENRWKIKFIPKFLLLFGGIVIPDHVVIDSDERKEQVIQIFKKVLIAGPNTSLVYGVSLVMIWFISLWFNVNHLSGILFTFMMTTALMTVLVVLSSRISRGSLYGDYAAKNALSQNESFTLSYLLQIASFIKYDEASSKYLFKLCATYLENTPYRQDQTYQAILSFYLEQMTFYREIGSTAIDQKIQQMISRLPRNEDGLNLYTQIIFYKKYLKDNEKVNQLLNIQFNKRFKVKEDVMEFYLKMINHVLKFNDEALYFSKVSAHELKDLSFIYEPLHLDFKIMEIK